MPALRLGPMLRYVDDTCATVWVEADGPATVSILGRETRTFHVAGHHYALVRLEGLEPGTATPYDVALDGERVWPEPGSGYPPSLIRTTGCGPTFRFAFGSCRVTAPHHEPYTLDKTQDKRGVGTDALQGLAARMRRTDPEQWPNALLFVGDQVYADEVSPQTLEFIRARRDTSVAPYEQVADFEEYSELYREAWSEPTVRWLLSTLPTSMIFDDHDIHDDWNTSQVWREDMAATSWWRSRIAGGLMAYWLYQHLGNMTPATIDEDGMLAELTGLDDGGPFLREFALRADAEADGHKGYRWSYRRDHGGVRLLVIDSRCGRVLEGDHREMVDTREWEWLEAQTGGDPDHLLIATSLPLLLPAAIHHLEGWNEAVCNGAWGHRLARVGERIRQAVDLEHWAAFHRSFRALVGLVREVGSGQRGRPPASIVVLSGDVHYSYVAQARFPAADGVRTEVYQVVCSPLRNPIQRSVQMGDRFARTRAGQFVGRLLARSAGVRTTGVSWDVVQGPWFRNAVSTVTLTGRAASIAFEQAPAGSGDDPRLVTVYAGDLTGGPATG